MAHDKTVKDLGDLTVPVRITRENIDQLLDARKIEVRMAKGDWWLIRRNGQTKRWVRDKARIYVPFKYGFKFYGAVDEHAFGDDGALNTAHFRVKPEIPNV